MDDWEVVKKKSSSNNKETQVNLVNRNQTKPSSTSSSYNPKNVAVKKSTSTGLSKIKKAGDKNDKTTTVQPQKKKVLNSVALFDLVILNETKRPVDILSGGSSSQLQQKSSLIQSSTTQSLNPMKLQQQVSQNLTSDLKPKQFIANKKKKKTLSTVKKKILMVSTSILFLFLLILIQF